MDQRDVFLRILRAKRVEDALRDFALVWAEEGLEAVRKVAKKSPEAFVAIAARICPNDVRLTLEQAIPGGMSLEDYSLMREVIATIREGLPEADQLQPGAVFQHVLEALHGTLPTERRRFRRTSFRSSRSPIPSPLLTGPPRSKP